MSWSPSTSSTGRWHSRDSGQAHYSDLPLSTGGLDLQLWNTTIFTWNVYPFAGAISIDSSEIGEIQVFGTASAVVTSSDLTGQGGYYGNQGSEFLSISNSTVEGQVVAYQGRVDLLNSTVNTSYSSRVLATGTGTVYSLNVRLAPSDTFQVLGDGVVLRAGTFNVTVLQAGVPVAGAPLTLVDLSNQSRQSLGPTGPTGGASASIVGWSLGPAGPVVWNYSVEAETQNAAGEVPLVEPIAAQDLSLSLRPLVTGSVPANGATNVSLNLTSVVLTFGFPMVASPTQAAVGVSPTFAWTPKWDATDQNLTLELTGALAPQTTFMVAVGPAAVTQSGFFLTATFTTSFSTGAVVRPVPSVIATLPRNGSTNVSVSTTVQVTFSVAMNMTQAETGFSLSPGMPSGTFSSPSPTTLIWAPSSPLLPNTTYAVMLSALAVSTQGVALGHATWFRFTTLAGPRHIAADVDRTRRDVEPRDPGSAVPGTGGGSCRRWSDRVRGLVAERTACSPTDRAGPRRPSPSTGSVVGGSGGTPTSRGGGLMSYARGTPALDTPGVVSRPEVPADGEGVPELERRSISDLRQFVILTNHQLGHYLRTNRFLGLWGFVVLVSGLTLAFDLQAGIPLVQQQQLHRVSEYLSNFYVWVGLFIILSAGFFGGDALSVDFSTGAGYYMLVLPVRRWALLAGRYVAATLATLAMVGTYLVFGLVGGAYFFGPASIQWGLVAGAVGLSILFSLAALSVAFTISAFFRSPASGVLVTILATYVGFVTLNQTVQLAGYEPWWSLTYAGGAMAALLDTDFIHLQQIPVGEDQVHLDLERHGPRRRRDHASLHRGVRHPERHPLLPEGGERVTGPSLEATDLTKSFGRKRPAVNGLTFQYEGSGAIGYLGPNGAGKTTTLKLLVGLLRPTAGQARVNGIDPSQDRKRALWNVGALIESPEPYPTMTVFQALETVGALRGLSRRDIDSEIDRCHELLELPGLGYRTGRLSKGELQRVVLAAALIGDPPLLILDEPTSGLDPAERVVVRSLLKRLKRDHLILMSSHQMGEVNEVCDQLMFIRRGELVVRDSVEAIMGRITSRQLDIEFERAVSIGQLGSVRALVSSVDTLSDRRVRVTFDGTTATRVRILDASRSIAPVVRFAEATMVLEEAYLDIVAGTLAG